MIDDNDANADDDDSCVRSGDQLATRSNNGHSDVQKQHPNSHGFLAFQIYIESPFLEFLFCFFILQVMVMLLLCSEATKWMSAVQAFIALHISAFTMPLLISKLFYAKASSKVDSIVDAGM